MAHGSRWDQPGMIIQEPTAQNPMSSSMRKKSFILTIKTFSHELILLPQKKILKILPPPYFSKIKRDLTHAQKDKRFCFPKTRVQFSLKLCQYHLQIKTAVL